MDPKSAPAFPFPDAQGPAPGAETGMTLRDYFAAKALQGLCANSGGPFQSNGRTGWGLVNCELSEIAALSYDMADAMLKARTA